MSAGAQIEGHVSLSGEANLCHLPGFGIQSKVKSMPRSSIGSAHNMCSDPIVLHCPCQSSIEVEDFHFFRPDVRSCRITCFSQTGGTFKVKLFQSKKRPSGVDLITRSWERLVIGMAIDEEGRESDLMRRAFFEKMRI